jgi:hypothetical protein
MNFNVDELFPWMTRNTRLHFLFVVWYGEIAFGSLVLYRYFTFDQIYETHPFINIKRGFLIKTPIPGAVILAHGIWTFRRWLKVLRNKPQSNHPPSAT